MAFALNGEAANPSFQSFDTNAFSVSGTGANSIRPSAIIAPSLVPAGAQFTDKGGYGGYNLTVTPNQLYYATATTNTAAYGLFIVDGTDINLDADLGPVNGASAPTPLFFTPTSSIIQVANDTVTTGSANQIAVYAVTNNLYGNFNGKFFGTNVGIGGVYAPSDTTAYSIPGGIKTIGSATAVVDGTFREMRINLANGASFRNPASSDTQIKVFSAAGSTNNSGGGFNIVLNLASPGGGPATQSLDDPNANSDSWLYMPTNGNAGLAPGTTYFVVNASPSLTAWQIMAGNKGGLGGNAPYFSVDFNNSVSGFPFWQVNAFKPTDAAWLWAFKASQSSGLCTTYSNLTVGADLILSRAGSGLQIKEGSNARMGTATLNGTTAVVVANTSVTATSRIWAFINLGSGTVGSPYVSARSVGTSFSLKSTTVGDTSTVAWVIIEPAP